MSREPAITYDADDGPRRAHWSWHRGDAKFHPRHHEVLAATDGIERFVLDGWAPPTPPIARDARVLAAGSCFARSVVHHLRRQQLSVNVVPRGKETKVGLFFFGGGFVNTFTLTNHFEWALGERELSNHTLWSEHPKSFHATKGGGKGKRIVPLPADDEARQLTRQAIEEANAYILTIGLSEIWFDKVSGDAFFKAVPEDLYDPERHGFRLATYDENVANLRLLYGLLRALKPNAPIVFTVSPVPLAATFRPVSAITANSVSKASVRLAVDTVVTEVDDPQLYYWPSYEIVLDLVGKHAAFENDYRHVKPRVVERIMQAFERCYVQPSASPTPASP